MALVLLGKTPCGICGRVLREGDDIRAFSAFVGDESDPLILFHDAAFHEECFAAHPLAEEAERRWHQALSAWAAESQARGPKWRTWERERGFIRARLRLRAAGSGGRWSAITDDYRASWDIGSLTEEGQKTLNDAPLTLEDAGYLTPGSEGIVRLHPIAPEFWSKIAPGMRIEMREAARTVGDAEILEVVPPEAGDG